MSLQYAALLLVPTDGDPAGLLATGRFPCWPPVASPTVTPIGTTWTATVTVVPVNAALVVWWDGAVVPEGWDRARRVLSRVSCQGQPWSVLNAHARAHDLWPNWETVRVVAAELVRACVASRIVLLLRDDLGRLLESTP